MFGASMLLDGQPRHAFPTAEAIIAATDQKLRGTGIGFKAHTISALAEWSLDSSEHLQPRELFAALQNIRGVGPWTAAVAVCDIFSDFSFYPIEDLAVRGRAHSLWPEHQWPKAPAKFATEWRTITGPHTAAITAFVLADAFLSAPSATLL
jgi:DNA-3-methyladenine glycosylase II